MASAALHVCRSWCASPGALRNGAPFKDWVLPGALEKVRRKLKGVDDDDRPPDHPATGRRESPLVSAIRTASLRNSSVLPVPMVHLLCCTLRDQRSGTKPRQVQPLPWMGSDQAHPEVEGEGAMPESAGGLGGRVSVRKRREGLCRSRGRF